MTRGWQEGTIIEEVYKLQQHCIATTCCNNNRLRIGKLATVIGIKDIHREALLRGKVSEKSRRQNVT